VWINVDGCGGGVIVGEHTVHTMPLDELRVRAREARRLIAQGREIARDSFEQHDREHPPRLDDGDASHRVGLLLDAAQRLLPGIASLAEERAIPCRSKHPPDSGWRRVTLRGGAERALESIERARILEDVADDAAMLIAEIARRSSSVFRTADVASSVFPPAQRATRSS
jgi:hypothetical protein